MLDENSTTNQNLPTKNHHFYAKSYNFTLKVKVSPKMVIYALFLFNCGESLVPAFGKKIPLSVCKTWGG